ncbi:hypothetical protein OQA88_12031 [Cercophora sp. LCS_1]
MDPNTEDPDITEVAAFRQVKLVYPEPEPTQARQTLFLVSNDHDNAQILLGETKLILSPPYSVFFAPPDKVLAEHPMSIKVSGDDSRSTSIELTAFAISRNVQGQGADYYRYRLAAGQLIKSDSGADVTKWTSLQPLFPFEQTTSILKNLSQVPLLTSLQVHYDKDDTIYSQVATTHPDLKRLHFFTYLPMDSDRVKRASDSFHSLEYLAVHEEGGIRPLPIDEEYLKYWKILYIMALKEMIELKHLAFTLKKDVALSLRWIPPEYGTDSVCIELWYSNLIVEFGRRLPGLESICVFCEHPLYYEGVRDEFLDGDLFVRRKSVDDLRPGEWPRGIA